MHEPPILSQFNTVVQRLDTITLDEMDRTQLLNRVDTKFLMHTQQLLQALHHVAAHYRVLEVNHVRLHRYCSLYFDTPNFAMYTRHHNGALNRYKVRYRQYVDSALSFLEVKHKTNKQRTIKYREPLAGMAASLGEEAYAFLPAHCPYTVEQLEPKLWNNFIRITLVSKSRIERLTLDLELQFRRNQIEVNLTDTAVAEVKQEKFSVKSAFVQQMRTMQVRPVGFSKYCMGAARLYPFLKQNLFKEKFLYLERVRHP
jgi:hypothetical protein